MKEILAIIRMNKMNDTKEALVTMGVSSFTARKVAGRGQGKVEYNIFHDGETLHVHSMSERETSLKLIPKRQVNIIVDDHRVDDVVQKLMSVNQTGHSGDGKIFVLPVEGAIRIRTGEINEAAIDENTVH